MVYLVKTIIKQSMSDYNMKTSLVKKSMHRKKLQTEIKKLFDEAVNNADEEVYINGCSKQDSDEIWFDENNLIIDMMFPPGMDREIICYAIVNDKYTEVI